jgi:alkaline phosphatase D
MRVDVTRRSFLLGLAASAAATAAGCSGSDDSRDMKKPGGGLGPTTTQHAAQLSGNPFQLGVASGDPLADRVILWTRLAPRPLTPGLGGMPDDKVDVIWQVATDERFQKVVTQGVHTAESASAHAVHVDAEGLDPASDYYYRFFVGEWTSPVGRTRTAADASPESLSLGVVTCQFFGTGRYAAYRHLLDENVDLVVHLGDYIYELPIDRSDQRVLPAGIPRTLDDYRLRYASYKFDADLQAAHARYPFMCMWDDHEVINNYSGDQFPDAAVTPAQVQEQKAAAYRAYWEHLPLRLSRPDGPEMTLYREVAFGDLARLYLLDERQYADEPPCRDQVGNDYGDCAERRTGDRVYLGAEQEAWFAEASAAGGVTWNLIGNPTSIAGINSGTAAQPQYFLENWTGYPAARQRFLERLGSDEVANPVMLTGDWHAGMVNDVHLDYEDLDSPVAAIELMTPAITSPVDAVPRDVNPQVRHSIERHGYMTVLVEPERLTAAFKILDDVGRADSGIALESTWQIDAGAASATRV